MVQLPLKRTPIAFLNLISQPTRAISSVLGVAFALLLVFMQLGFRGAVGNTATIVYGRLEGDLVMRSPDYVHLYEPRTIDRSWMHMAEGFPAVERVDPFFIMLHRWQNPVRNPTCEHAPPDGSYRTVGMMGVQIDRPVLKLPELDEKLGLLKDPDSMLVDRATRAEYGPENCKKFSDDDIGKITDLGGKATRIAGHFQLGTGLATNGAVLISDVGFARRTTVDVTHRASLGLIRLKPGHDPNVVKKDLIEWIGQKAPEALLSVQILTMEEQLLWERKRWLNETPIGMIFTMGVILSFIIGAAIVYMVLATDVASRLPEYATLKAMGYSPVFVASIVFQQAWLLALLGYFPSFVCAWLLYLVTVNLSGIPTFMTWQRAFGVFGLAVLMCSISGMLAVRKLFKAEPANLF